MNIYFNYVDKLNNGYSGQELLKKALKAYNEEYGLGLSNCSMENEEILRTEKGKPYFKNIQLHFSISHSANAWVCAMGDCQVGIDIQKAKNAKTIEVAKRFFTKEEADFVSDNDPKSFFQIWSRKEAFVKYIGEGISFGFDKFSVAVDGKLQETIKSPIECCICEVDLIDDFECCICTAKKEKICIIKI